jgi:RNA polymerase sigma-70 factor (ECF subfamily)
MFSRRSFHIQLQKELRAYAIALTKNEDVAEDLVQDTLLKIFEGNARPVIPDKAKRYAFRMLRNLHIDNLRKSRVRLEYSAEQERLYSAGPKFDSVEQLIIRDAFAQLKPEHREILFLIDVMGFRYKDAAETLSVAIGTVMSRVSRARAEMMEIMDSSTIRSLDEHRKKTS